MLPETERRIVFESEANLHAPTKTTKDDYDALLKVAENAQLHAASQQRVGFYRNIWYQHERRIRE